MKKRRRAGGCEEKAGMDADRQDRSLAALLTDLQRETARMIQQEFALARAETGERVRKLAMGLGLLVAAIVVSFVALIIVLMGLSELVGEFMPEALAFWLGYLIVGGAALTVGVGLLVRGIKNLSASGRFLERTSHSIEQDLEVVMRQRQT
jgi:Putative Actinobacterial Holin-X, holin superfamily III